MATIYDSADLLAKFRLRADRPSTDEDLSDPDIYSYLTDAQITVYGDLTALFPRLLMNDPELMQTTNGGKTYHLPVDSEGSTVWPFGHAEVYAQAVNGSELYGSTYSGYNGDFVFEGSQIVVPAGNTRTFSAGPYIRYVGLPLAINASTQPILNPKQLRLLILYRALVHWANTGGHRDPRPFEEEYDRLWTGKNGGFLAMLTTQYRQSTQAAMAGIDWWRYWRMTGGNAQYPLVLG